MKKRQLEVYKYWHILPLVDCGVYEAERQQEPNYHDITSVRNRFEWLMRVKNATN
jgi:hypothetical protein